MFLRQLYDADLSQSSYVLGCRELGEAIVVDPLRDPALYTALAASEGLRIVAVTETHVHADFVSGARALAARTGATIYLSGEGASPSVYGYATQPAPGEHVQLLHDGDHIAFGRLLLEVWCTPGHTPEHLAFLVNDTRHLAGPMAILTGDFVLVGNVGRPETAAWRADGDDAVNADDAEQAAVHAPEAFDDATARLFDSLRRFCSLPDHVQVLPAHSADARGGRAVDAVLTSTVGYEKRTNWALRTHAEDEVVDRLRDEQREPTRHAMRMTRVNRIGPAVSNVSTAPLLLDPYTIERHMARASPTSRTGGAPSRWVLDLRGSSAFVAAHIPGSVSLPRGRHFAQWAGEVLPDDCELLLLADDGYPDDAVRALTLIGFDRVIGWMDATDAATAWRAAGHAFASFTEFDIRTLAVSASKASADGLVIVDVSDGDEWRTGHLPDALHITLEAIATNDAVLPDRPFAVYCQTGARSVIAASLLHRLGRTDVVNLTGGFAAWKAAGLPSVLQET